MIKRLPTIFLSLCLTVLLYILFFILISIGGGNEASDPNMALGAFVAMTFFVHFPLAWFICNTILKKYNKKATTMHDQK
ncbi:hypothetical protein EJF36_12710 [Bacillus sp. HMF5848]|uniref:hypothetical protein n=1 Tax=Bacillus sp. HMF5848 TaxID=2495421 RepID=UPI000F7ACC7F|nr:hypothetical protein [Bacillus sp. HMF5848]RSK27668.1 hypothetical protein EJF36_12710 [Bacillus sp. HMF5848]